MLVFLTILFIVYLIYDTYKKNKKKHANSPTGPFAIPIIGNVFQMKYAEFVSKNQEHKTVSEYGSQYNGVMRMWLGDRYFIFISNLEILRIIQKDDNYNRRPSLLLPSWKYVTEKGAGVMGSSDEWSKGKTSIIQSFKKYASKELYEEKSMEFMGLLEKRYENRKEIFYPKNFMYGYVVSIIFKYMFNRELSIDSSLGTDVGNAIMHSFVYAAKLTVFDVFKVLDPFYNWYFSRRYKKCDLVRHLISDENRKHLESIDPNNPRDLMDELLIEYGLNDITEQEKVQVNQICFDIFGPSVGSVTIILCWTLLQLCNRQDFQEFAYKQIKDAVNDEDSVKLSHKSSAPYIIAFIKETMRLCSSGFGIPRTSTNDHMCGDFLIPKDSIILINYLQIHQTERQFKNPTEFDPTRYLEDSIETPNLHFGAGLRACPGRWVAIDEMFLCISNILLKYRVVSTDGKKIDDSIQYSLTLRSKEFGIFLENRN